MPDTPNPQEGTPNPASPSAPIVIKQCRLVHNPYNTDAIPFILHFPPPPLRRAEQRFER